MAACHSAHAHSNAHIPVCGPMPAVLSHTLEQSLISAVMLRAQREDRSADTRAFYTVPLIPQPNRRNASIYASGLG